MKTKIESEKTTIENDKTLIKSTPSHIQITTFQNYQIIKQFQVSGSEADIYLVKKDDIEYILKLYRFGIEPKEEIVEKLKYLSENYHNQIVKIYEIGKESKTRRFYEIQEYVENGSLVEFREFDIRDVIRQIVDILHTLHSQHIIHRDLKPSNILVRSIKPLNLVITDFGISSVKDSELSKIMTSKSGTISYFSPESFSGVIGQGVDYWAFGMIVLEFVSRENLFGNINEEMIVYTLNTKNITIPKEIDSELQNLLKGLLTRDPKRRWGYEEVSKWLSGESVEVFYEEEGLRKAYLFEKRRFYSLDDLLLEFVKSEEFWESGKAHLFRGYITKWLESEGDFDRSVEVEKFKNQSENKDLALFGLINSFHRELDFVVCGKKITLSNLVLFMQKRIKGEESRVSQYLLGGELLEFYTLYLKFNVQDDIYSKIFEEIASFYGKKDEIKRVEIIYKYLEFCINQDFNYLTKEYYLPSNFKSKIKKEFMLDELYKLIKKVDFDNYCEEFVVPNYLVDEVKNSTYSKYFKALSSLKKLNIPRVEELEIYDNQIIQNLKSKKYLEYNRELKRLMELREYAGELKRRKKITKLENLNLSDKIGIKTFTKIEKIKNANIDFDDYNRLTSITNFRNKKLKTYAKKLLSFKIKWTKTDSNIIKIMQKKETLIKNSSMEHIMASTILLIISLLIATIFFENIYLRVGAFILIFCLAIVFNIKGLTLKQIIKNQAYIRRIEEVLN